MKHTLFVSALIPAMLLSFVVVGTASAQTTASAMVFSGSNLGVGSSGDDVVTLQSYLESKGYLKLNGATKGYFGALTKAALVQYQGENGLPSTGFFGPLTMAKLSTGGSMMTSTSGTIGAMMTPTANTKAADLRVLLNALEREHVALASNAVRAGFDGRADFSASAQTLDNNSVELSKAIGSIYGDAAAAKFLDIWRSHITFFVNYTVAAKKGDTVGMTKAVNDLGGYVDAISDFFSGANPNLPRDAVHQLVAQHVGLLKAAVDTYGAADFAGSYKNQHDAYNQIGTIADAISGAIVKQYPDKF